MINVTQNKELILSPFCYSSKVFADDLISKLEQHGYRFTISEAPTGITIKWTEYSSMGYDEEFLKERRKVLEKYLNEDEPQTERSE